MSNIDGASYNFTSNNKKIFMERGSWLGRNLCQIDKLTLLFGTTLLISGIALFIINALAAANLYAAAVAATSVGGSLFTFGLITHCCASLKSGNFKKLADSSASKPINLRRTLVPLNETTTIKQHFHNKGIFGVPEKLIDELEVWRKCRLGKVKDIALGAGFILHGPPGCGKTTIAKVIAEILGGEYIEHKCGDLLDKHQGETEKNITQLFTIPDNEFRVILIDEISGLLSHRNQLQPHHNGNVEHFLGVVNGLNQTNPRYLLIGTTNDIKSIDGAVARQGRLGEHFELLPPNLETRINFFNHRLEKLTISTSEDWSNFARTLALNTDNFSGAALESIISDALKKRTLENREFLLQKDFQLSNKLN